jgi:hypothetical protein
MFYGLKCFLVWNRMKARRLTPNKDLEESPTCQKTKYCTVQKKKYSAISIFFKFLNFYVTYARDCIIFSCILLISNSMVSRAVWKNIHSWVFQRQSAYFFQNCTRNHTLLPTQTLLQRSTLRKLGKIKMEILCLVTLNFRLKFHCKST